MKKNSAAPSLGKIDHIAIVVKNMNQTIQFYKRFLGFKVEREFGNQELGVHAVVMKRRSDRIELFEYLDDKPEYAKRKRLVHGGKVPKEYFSPGIKHIAFKSTSFKKSVERLNRAGFAPWIKPKTGYSGDSITFFQDPNGILLEVISPIGRRKNKAKKK